MKKEYVIAMGVNRPNSGYKFTKYKSYEVLGWFGKSAEVRDDDGKRCFVAVGIPTMRLDDGQFVKVSFPSAQEAMEYAQRTAEQAIRDLSKGSGWRLEKDGVFIASGNFNAAENYIVVNGKTYTESQIAKLEKDAADYKADCIKAEKVIDQLYEIITEARNHDQLISAIRTSKVFSDAFLELQKNR